MMTLTANEQEMMQNFYRYSEDGETLFVDTIVNTHADAGTLGSLIKKGVFEEWEYDLGMMCVRLTDLGKSLAN